MKETPRSGALTVVTAVLVAVFLFAACARTERTAPVPPAPASAPAAAPSQTGPATTPAASPGTPTAGPAGQPRPLVVGGPPFFAEQIASQKGWQYMQRWHQGKLSLWTTAKYGGEGIGPITFFGFTESSYRLLSIPALNRPSTSGMLLYTDMGRCSWVGRDDFSVCKGEQARNKAIVVVPGILQKWEQPDPVTYVFTVRKGVLWPAAPPMARVNRELTADDVVFFLDVTRRDGIVKSNFTLVKTIDAPDRYTVRITLAEPNADFLKNMAHTSMGIFSRECYEEKGCMDEIKTKSPGPFLVTDYQPRIRLALDKNPEFYLKGLPYLDKLTVLSVPDVSTQKAAFLTGKNDFFSGSRLSETEDLLRRVPGAQVHAQGGTGGVTVTLRPQIKGPLGDVRVRRAMSMTMDHPSLWEASIDGFSLFVPLISRDYFGEEFYMTLQQAGEFYQFNPERAKALVTEAGYPQGFATSLLITSSSGRFYDESLFLQSQWKRHLGVDVSIKVVDGVTFNNQFYAGSWEGLVHHGTSWIRSAWGTADDAFAQFIKGSPQNVQGLDDRFLNEIYPRQRAELDPAKRVKLLWEADQYELTQTYQLRIGVASTFTFMQPWELNGASHETNWFTSGPAGVTWMAMHDTSKYPSGR
ncbi:MAG: ABC transporter substrate-binding protein [SAR202 cluster bacterium]|nr:ABC transporter substrate-binding protein [SAR202 cluster bacterium]